MDDTDDNVEARSLIKRYEERPQDVENVCLADFACWYTDNKAPLSQISESLSGWLFWMTKWMIDDDESELVNKPQKIEQWTNESEEI